MMPQLPSGKCHYTRRTCILQSSLLACILLITLANSTHAAVRRSQRSHERSARSAGQVDEPGVVGNCSFAASCSLRHDPPSLEFRYPCRCDVDCGDYGDCCHDVTPTYAPHPFTCARLYPTQPYYPTKNVFMITECPAGTLPRLSDRCTKTSSNYTYLMDIPVLSTSSKILYANLFCAQCHEDTKIKRFPYDLMCSTKLSGTAELSRMVYRPQQLTWQTLNNKGGCSLRVDYDEDIGRVCERDLVNECMEDWQAEEVRQKCSSYNYYVSGNGKTFKNRDCAICNNVSIESLGCLSLKPPLRGIEAPFIPSLSDLFNTVGDCEEDEIWDPLYRRCEHVSCGFLFTLKDGECVYNDIPPISRDKRSYLNSSCYTTEFQRSYSVMFPNKTIYLNYTERFYDIGEYELVNHSWVRVCRPEEHWTPAMNVLSTILICISLVCMLLHIAIFLMLPKRQNIPSMNLFSMTCSLFVAELFFVSLFRANKTYGTCVAMGVLMYYFLMGAFMWMNVMSIDICRTFHSNRYKIKSRQIFIQYSVYAWGVPLFFTFIALMVDQIASETFVLSPQFGTHNCWFNNKWGLVTFFTVPSGLIVCFNMVLYGISVYDIYKQQKSGEFASASVRKGVATGRKQSASKKERDTFLDSGFEHQDHWSYLKSLMKKDKGSSEAKAQPSTSRETKKDRLGFLRPFVNLFVEDTFEPPKPPTPPPPRKWYQKPLDLFTGSASGQMEQTPSPKKRSHSVISIKRSQSIPRSSSMKRKQSGYDSDSSLRRPEGIRERIQKRIEVHEKQRLRLILYCKLAILMGLTWIFAFISIHTKSLTFEYLFIIFNGLQGAFIFIAFDCKKKIWEEIRVKLGATVELARGLSGSSSVSKPTSHTLVSHEGPHRFKWTAARRSTWHAPATPQMRSFRAAHKHMLV